MSYNHFRLIWLDSIHLEITPDEVSFFNLITKLDRVIPVHILTPIEMAVVVAVLVAFLAVSCT